MFFIAQHIVSPFDWFELNLTFNVSWSYFNISAEDCFNLREVQWVREPYFYDNLIWEILFLLPSQDFFSDLKIVVIWHDFTFK